MPAGMGRGGQAVVAVTIDLQDGFNDDRVIIVIDGRNVFDKTGVRTRYQVNLAARVTVDLAPGRHRVEAALPDRDRRGEVELDPSHTPFLAVSVDASQVVLRPAARAFHYV